ncbi:hypothetical protein TIFTF001_050970 [Ficus carica]|uniref:Uncharacterized protein n=1 Tax=Ficus carica TaxID=3494 RepID=A0AA87YVS9_FICCA|nr:hypothetical protein TIFTF001_050970 [Ficus carica]
MDLKLRDDNNDDEDLCSVGTVWRMKGEPSSKNIEEKQQSYSLQALRELNDARPIQIFVHCLPLLALEQHTANSKVCPRKMDDLHPERCISALGRAQSTVIPESSWLARLVQQSVFAHLGFAGKPACKLQVHVPLTMIKKFIVLED